MHNLISVSANMGLSGAAVAPWSWKIVGSKWNICMTTLSLGLYQFIRCPFETVVLADCRLDMQHDLFSLHSPHDMKLC